MMKRFIAMIMVIAMVAAFVPATLAVEADAEASATLDKSQFTKTIDNPTLYSTDNNGNKIATGSTTRTSVVSDLSHVNKDMMSMSANETKGWYDSMHYGVELFDQSMSMEYAYEFQNSDFTASNDFLTSGTTSYGMFFSPANSAGNFDNTGFRTFRKGEKFWFNFDIISGYSASVGGPTYFSEDVAFSVYMYAGTTAQWGSDTGLPLSASWQGSTRISVNVTVPVDNQVYMFFVVVQEADMQAANARGFGGWLAISEHDKTYREAKVQGTIEPGKQYTADLGGADSELLLLYGDDLGNVLAYGSLYEVELKAGERYILTAEGNGRIGGRVFFLDENKDIITSNFLGTGAVTGGDSYRALDWPVFPPVDGKYHILVAGFFMGDEGEMQFELIDYDEARAANPDYVPYLPDLSDVNIDLDDYGTTDVIETVEGIEVWAYFYYAEFGMGALVLAFPGNYHVKGEKTDMFVEVYDGVVLDLQDASVGTVWTEGTWAPSTINATGKGKMSDNYFGAALLNDIGSYSSVYLTGDSLEIAGELSCGALMEVPTHILTKSITASATVVSGSYSVAFWVAAWNTPKLTWGDNAKILDSTGSELKQTSIYFDPNNNYLNGYTVSPYATLQRYGGSQSYYYISDYFTATTSGIGGGDPVVNVGDANVDGRVNTGDATAILKHVAGLAALSQQGMLNADMNGDGMVNTGDATAVLRSIVD